MAEDGSEQQDAEQVALRAVLRRDDEGFGVYSNFAQVRNTEHDFVIDFAQVLPLGPAEVETMRRDGEVQVPTRVRVVLPASIIPRLIEALTSRWEGYRASVESIERERHD